MCCPAAAELTGTCGRPERTRCGTCAPGWSIKQGACLLQPHDGRAQAAQLQEVDEDLTRVARDAEAGLEFLAQRAHQAVVADRQEGGHELAQLRPGLP